MSFSVPSNDDAVYAEVNEAAANNFAMDENICYEGVSSNNTSNIRSNASVQANSNIKKVFLMLFVLVIALLLGTVCACIAFALEISSMKSKLVSCQQHSQSHITLDEKIELLNSSILEQIRQLDNRTLELSGETQFLSNALNPTSCADLPSFTDSGHYWIQPSTGQPAEQVYCDFNRQCGCGGSSAWTRVAFLNMSDPNEVCPSNWETYTSPVRACGNGQNNIPRCISVIYPAYGLRYNRVCGRVIGYQHSDTIAFAGLAYGGLYDSVERNYLHGVSITHGGAGSRQHIWSFASAIGDAFVAEQPRYSCSCSSSNNWPYSTSFVGNDYFCDTGSHASSYPRTIFASDPLWDGAGCGPSSTCCTFNNPPWFCKTLPQPTTDDLEVRICESSPHRDTPIQLMEIFVQ